MTLTFYPNLCGIIRFSGSIICIEFDPLKPRAKDNFGTKPK
jgi:hypothetical protein